MRILLDSHAFLWFVLRKPQLSRSADALISDPSNVVLVSPATCWEIAIKVGKNKLDLMASCDDFMRQGIEGNDFTTLLQALGLVNLHLRIHVSEQRFVPPGGLTTDSTDNTDNEFTISVPSVSSVVKRRLTRKKAAIERRSSFSCLWCISWFSNKEL